MLKQAQTKFSNSCLEGHQPQTYPLQSAAIKSYPVVPMQISQHTKSLHLENIACCLKHHSSCALLAGILAAQTSDIYWESPTYWRRMPKGSPGKSFGASQLGYLFRLHSWYYMWAACLSFCLWGWETSPLCCLKTVKLFEYPPSVFMRILELVGS